MLSCWRCLDMAREPAGNLKHLFSYLRRSNFKALQLEGDSSVITFRLNKYKCKSSGEVSKK